VTAEIDANKAQTGARLAVLLFVLIAGAAVAAGLWFGVATFRGLSRSAPLQLQAGTLLPQPRPLADFSLTDQDGRPFSLANLRGHWTFLAIGYTSCPDICPMTLATLDALEGAIAKEDAREGGQPACTVPVHLRGSRARHPGAPGPIRALFQPRLPRGHRDDAQLRALAAQLGVLYAKVDGRTRPWAT